MIFKRGRYSGFLRPISYLIDLLIIGFFANNIILEKSDLLNFIDLTSSLLSNIKSPSFSVPQKIAPSLFISKDNIRLFVIL